LSSQNIITIHLELLVPLLKSLFCLKGHDNGRRFLIVSLVCYLLLILLSSVLSKALILVIMLLMISTPILATSAMRRIHDAGFATPFAVIPVAIYWLNLFGISYIEHGSRWALLALAVVVTMAMATISNARIRRNHNYHFGYHGPVNLNGTDEIPVQLNRIEPTIAGQKTANINPEISTSSDHLSTNENNRTTGTNNQRPPTNHWEQQLGKWFINNRKLSSIIISVFLLVSFMIALLPLFDDEHIDIPEKETQKTNMAKQKIRLNKIEMPDQFWVMLDQNDALTIGWEGDIKTESDLDEDNSYWSAYTGKGDKTCVDLHFSLGDEIKTLLVTVKNGGDYYADFSPVDTEIIVKSIADKDRFKLCGYEFVLKGTRSLLRKNSKYSKYLKLN